MAEFDYSSIRGNAPDDPAFSWAAQAVQYPQEGEAGISYFEGRLPGGKPVDCLLYRDDSGALIGVLNRFPVEIAPYERAGNASVWVHPDHQRRGVGSALIIEALERWGLTGDHQSFTDNGAAFADRLVRRLTGSSYDFRIRPETTGSPNPDRPVPSPDQEEGTDQ